MRYYLLLISFFLSLNLFAQQDTDLQACNRSKDITGTQGVSYYQYPSMNKYDIKYMKLDLSVETGTKAISGTSLTVAKVLATLDTFIIEFKNHMIVDSVFVNGTKKLFTEGADHIYIPVVPALATGTTISTLIYYRGTTGSGVYSGTVPSNGLNYTATLSESYQAREWFPAKQILTDKIDSADLWFTTSAINKVGSNGLLKAVVPLAGGKVQYQWKEKYPMNYYMPSFSVGNYLEYLNYAKPLAMAPDSILIQHYIVNNPTYFATIKANLDKTPPFLEKMSELFSLYPFKNEKYGHAHANIGGGMEHQTMSTMAGFSSTLIAHELGHQWWGDNVTCATWNHIWLNEGFASYCEYLMIENFPALIPSTNPTAFMQGYHNTTMGAAGGSVYVPDVSLFDEGRIFSNRLSYAKGAAVIHTLRFEMQNDNLFFQALKNFQQQYKDSVATTNDFKLIAETVSGRSLTDYFNQWIYGEGYPTINVTFYKEGSDVLVLRINQTTSMPAVTPFFKGLFEFRVASAAGDTTVKINLSANNQEFRFNYTKTPTNIVIDPNNWVLNLAGTITNLGVTLPASQVTLSGAANNECAAQLSWITTLEHNISKYEIEYSSDNVIFTKVGEQAGLNTNMDQLHVFSHVPAVKTGIIYYRLKIIDTLGNLRYSNTISIPQSCVFDFKLGPIPTSGLLYLYVTSPEASNASIALFNSLGELVYKDQKAILPGDNTITLSMVKFPRGNYHLRILTNGKKINKKVVKI